ncbi:MAG TPA: STAS domain-containing protein [Pyrinomonadaceae bacterium]|nr:STAS domain-containing protein [Pyrinomonadaceae bacterium]
MRHSSSKQPLPYELSLSDKDRSSAVSNIGIKERRVGDVTILSTDGEIRIGLRFGGSSVSLPSAVDSLLEQGQRHILLNLEGVVSIDARGLGELVSTHIAVTRSGGQFKLLNLTQMLRELMMTTKLLTVFDVYETEAQAVDSFADDIAASAEAATAGARTSGNANSLKDY